MKEIIAREGDDQLSNWYVMAPGAMKFDEDAVYPVTWDFNNNRPPIGKARNVHRDEEGHIIAEIEIFDAPYKEDLKPPMVGFFAYSDDVTLVPQEPIAEAMRVRRVVESTTLRSVGCVIVHGNPRAKA